MSRILIPSYLAAELERARLQGRRVYERKHESSQLDFERMRKAEAKRRLRALKRSCSLS